MKANDKYMNEAEARRLLKLWYEADIDSTDESRLIQWFSQTPDNELPDDLLPDAEIFKAMAGETADENTVDRHAAVFERKLVDVAKSGNRRFAAWLSAAAMVAVIAVSAVTFISRDTDLSQATDLTATVITPSDTSNTSDNILSSNQPDSASESTQHNITYVSNQTDEQESADDITVEEARRALNKMYALIDKAEIQSTLDTAFGLLDKGVETSRECLAEPEKTLSRIDRTLTETFEKTSSFDNK